MKTGLIRQLKVKIQDSTAIDKLNDFELGVLKGYLMAKNNEQLEAVVPFISAEEGDFSKGIQYGYLESMQPTDQTAPELKPAIDSYRSNRTRENFVKVLDAYDRYLNIVDENFTIYEDEGGEDRIGVEYDKDQVAEIKKALEEDSNTEIVEKTDNGYIVGEKVSDADEYTIEKVNNNKYNVLKSGVPTYVLEKKNTNWHCSCPGFVHRGKCKHLGMLEDVIPKRKPRESVEAFVPEINKVFEGFDKFEIVGSWRRGKSTVKDIDILVQCTPSEFKIVLERLQQDPNYSNTMNGPDIIRGNYQGFDFDVTRVNEGEWGAYLLYRTGNANFNMKMRALAKKKGYRLNEHGLFDESGNCIARETEEDIFKALGMRYFKPEDREF